MNRGDIWWAQIEPKARPVVLISRQSHILSRDKVMVAQVTSRVRGLLSEVPLDPRDGLRFPCVADAGTLHSVHKSRLLRRVAKLSGTKLDALDAALRFALGLD
ncbi:MAG: type II toxin-antitoxin system PemK/MazF family toxin [Elusimicrobia bacterium]|nr:type II toxin-antitoxin system PemK/MazF family toxin [Elusimicrobiota bacterium]